ncbi:hypothetical protein SEVIR_1G340400v4 [Setaria viridis]
MRHSLCILRSRWCRQEAAKRTHIISASKLSTSPEHMNSQFLLIFEQQLCFCSCLIFSYYSSRSPVLLSDTCDVEHGDRQHESHLVTLTRLLYFYHLYACVTGCG